MRIWIPMPYGEEMIEGLRAQLPEHVFSQETNPESEVMIEGRPTREQLESAPGLRAVVAPFAGLPPATLELMREFPQISLHNLHHNASDTAEAAIALLMAAAKRTIPADQALRRNDWRPRYDSDQDLGLMGKTAVILGYGEVGKRIGRILEAMGLEVIGVRRSPGGESGVIGIERLQEVLPKAQVLVVAVPLTAETKGRIGAREFDLLPPGSIVVNVARGPVIEEEPFFHALKSGKLHSAGSDVWYQYPQQDASSSADLFAAPASAANTPPANFPFGELPNMVLSPHRGGSTQDTDARAIRQLASMIQTLASGMPMPNRVDLDRGY